MLIVLGTMSFTTTTNELTFCDGWSDGYKKGWCYQRTLGCIEPIVPLCPMVTIYDENTYTGGYNKGFLTALYDRNKPR